MYVLCPLNSANSKDAFDYLNQGGYVMLPLVAVSLWMWYLIVKKLVTLAYWRKQWRRRAAGGGVSEIMKAFETRKTNEPDLDKKLLQSIIRKYQNELDCHVQTIFVLASIAPLLGLLGTVTGMISTFEAISRFGTANARALASGISEALITTQIGLIIAIPGLFMGNFIRKRTDNIQLKLEKGF